MLGCDCRQTYVVMATIYDDDYYIFEALKAGAHGYLFKDQPREDLFDKLQGILKGDPPLSPSVARRILRYFKQTPETQTMSPLSRREEDVLVLIAKGYHVPKSPSCRDWRPTQWPVIPGRSAASLKVSSRAEVTLEATRLAGC